MNDVRISNDVTVRLEAIAGCTAARRRRSPRASRQAARHHCFLVTLWSERLLPGTHADASAKPPTEGREGIQIVKAGILIFGDDP